MKNSTLSHTSEKGSKFYLYGTNTESSDTDYKGLFLPSIRDFVFNKRTKSIYTSTKDAAEGKNSKDDVDFEIYSMQYFGKLLYEGQTSAIDMLCSRPDQWITTTKIWEYVYSKRDLFISKSLKSVVAYSKKQAAKYGIKGSKIQICNEIIHMFKNKDPNQIVHSVLTELKCIKEKFDPDEEVLSFIILPNIENAQYLNFANAAQSTMYIMGRQFPLTTPINRVEHCLQRILKNYGDRAKLASENDGVDWKAIHHAFRFGYMVKHIVEQHKILSYPLCDEEMNFIMDVKLGKLEYKNIVNMLEDLIANTRDLIANSDFPDVPNMDWYNNLIVNLYR